MGRKIRSVNYSKIGVKIEYGKVRVTSDLMDIVLLRMGDEGRVEIDKLVRGSQESEWKEERRGVSKEMIERG
jgi:hypothetical protein